MAGGSMIAFIVAILIAASLFVSKWHRTRTAKGERGVQPFHIIILGLILLILGAAGVIGGLVWWRYSQHVTAPSQGVVTTSTAEKPPSEPSKPQINYMWAFVLADALRSVGMPNEEFPYVISSDTENDIIKRQISTILRSGIPSANPISSPPDDLDAPKLPLSDKSGIIIHGDSQFAGALFRAFSQCFVVYRTQTFVDDLKTYYAKFGKKDVTWIEIGPGFPGKQGAGACFEPTQ